MLITNEYLHSIFACRTQLDWFDRIFPDGALLTEDNVLKAYRGGLDIFWVIKRLEGNTDLIREEVELAWDLYSTELGPAREALYAEDSWSNQVAYRTARYKAVLMKDMHVARAYYKELKRIFGEPL